MKTMYFKAAAVWKLLNSIGNQFNNNVKMPLNVSNHCEMSTLKCSYKLRACVCIIYEKLDLKHVPITSF